MTEPTKIEAPNVFFVVQANAVAGEDSELSRWYEEQHLDDCLACDTAVSAQRFRKVPDSGPGNFAYLALYEIGDPQRFAEDRRSKESTPLLPRSAALALPAHAFFYRPAICQPALLARPERVPLYIEFLDAGLGHRGLDLIFDRHIALAKAPGILATELLMVDDYQERQGWHADAIIFAQILGEVSDDWRPAYAEPTLEGEIVREAGVYRPISRRRVKS